MKTAAQNWKNPIKTNPMPLLTRQLLLSIRIETLTNDIARGKDRLKSKQETLRKCLIDSKYLEDKIRYEEEQEEERNRRIQEDARFEHVNED